MSTFPITRPASSSLVSRPSSALMMAAGWMMVAAVALAPWAFGSRPYFWSTLLAGFLLVSGLVWFIGLFDERRWPRVPAWCLAVIAFLGGYIVVSLLNPRSIYDADTESFLPVFGYISGLPSTVDLNNSLPSAISAVGMLAALIVATDLSSFAPWGQRFVTAIALSGISVVVGGLLLKAGLSPSLSDFLERRPWSLRDAFGPLDYHGTVSSFINLSLPAVGWKLAQTRSLAFGLLCLIGVVLMLIAALLNASRTGFALTLSSLLVITLLVLGSWRNRGTIGSRKWGGLLVLGVAGSLGALAVFLVISRGDAESVTRFKTLKSEAMAPWNPRYQQVKASWELAQETPWFGQGVGSYKLIIPFSSIRGNYFAGKFVPGTPYTVLNHHAQNDYLQTLVEWGWVGFAGWGILAAGACRGLIRKFRQLAVPSLPWVMVILALGATGLHAIVDCPFQIPALQLYVMVYLGLALSRLSPMQWDTTRAIPAPAWA